MQTLNVVVADPMHEAGIQALSEHHKVSSFQPGQREACMDAIAQADAVVVRTFEIRTALLERSPRLKAVVKHGAGVDNIDIPAATRLGIVVANSGDANAQSVAEASVTLMLSALRRIPQMHQVVTTGHYADRWKIMLEGAGGKTLGIIGFGNIGRRVARMCAAGFDMQVLAYDPFLTARQIEAAGARKVDTLEQLLQEADIVSIHASLAEDSRCLIGGQELARMKKTAVLVNTSRGGVVDEAALAQALASNQLYAAGLDVFETEPPSPDNPLFALPNVVLMPHVGGATESTRRLMAMRSAQAVIATLAGTAPEFFLNPTVWAKRRL